MAEEPTFSPEYLQRLKERYGEAAAPSASEGDAQRSPSVARDIAPAQHPFDAEAGRLSGNFRREASGQDQQIDARESDMVKDDQPRHDLHPPPALRFDADAESFDDRWAKEADAAAKHNGVSDEAAKSYEDRLAERYRDYAAPPPSTQRNSDRQS